MKIKILLLLFSTVVFSQDHFNFSITDNNIIWQKVFNDSISPDALLKKIRMTGNFEQSDITNEGIDFRIRYTRDDFKKYGYKSFTGAMFLGHGGTCTGNIEFKENRFRVTIFSTFTNAYPPYVQSTDLKEWIVRRGKFTTDKTALKGLEYFDMYFNDIFTGQLKTEDW